MNNAKTSTTVRNEVKACYQVAEMNLNDLVLCCTAFRSFAEFEASAAIGYVPTLIVKRATGRSYNAVLHQVCVNTLAGALKGRGFKVWTGQN